MGNKRIIFYDTETTGIRHEKDRIIELAAYDPADKREFEQLINPGCPIPPEASNIHHITDEMVKDAPSFAEVGKAFAEFCTEDAILIAHNNEAFDKLFLESEYKRNQLDIPSWRHLDSLKWSRKYRPDLPRHSLQHLREVYGIPANNAHRALDDVIVLYEVFSRMIDDLSVETIINLLEKPQKVLNMPFGKHQGKPLSQVPKNYVRWLADSGSFEKPQNKDLRAEFEKLGMLT